MAEDANDDESEGEFEMGNEPTGDEEPTGGEEK